MKFDATEHSDSCVQSLNGQVIKGRKISAFLWDGKTKYKMEETEEDRKRRLEQWDKFIEGSGSEDDSSSHDEEEHAIEEEMAEKRRKVEKEDEDEDFEEEEGQGGAGK